MWQKCNRGAIVYTVYDAHYPCRGMDLIAHAMIVDAKAAARLIGKSFASDLPLTGCLCSDDSEAREGRHRESKVISTVAYGPRILAAMSMMLRDQ